MCKIFANLDNYAACVQGKVAGVFWLSVSAKNSLRAFVEHIFAKFCYKNAVFEGKQSICGCQDDFCWDLYESRVTFIECSTKAGWLFLKRPKGPPWIGLTSLRQDLGNFGCYTSDYFLHVPRKFSCQKCFRKVHNEHVFQRHYFQC